MTYHPPQCTEREPGGYEDCTWTTGVMFENAQMGRAARPSTRAEYEGLRVDGGDGPAENPGDGSNYAQLQAGLRVRYGSGHDGVRLTPSTANLTALLVPGCVLGVQGSMGAFPAGHRLRRWDPGFAGAHSALVVVDDDGSLWWQNPLAPNDFPGETIGGNELRAYYSGLPGAQVLVGTVGSLADGGDMPGLATTNPRPGPAKVRTKPGGGRKGIRVADQAIIGLDGIGDKDSGVLVDIVPVNVQGFNFSGPAHLIGFDTVAAMVQDMDDISPTPPPVQPGGGVDEVAIRKDQLARDRRELLPDRLAEEGL